MNRRTFINKSTCGIGYIALGTTGQFITTACADKNTKITKKLIATTDYGDNIQVNHNGSRYGEPLPRSAGYYQNNTCYLNKEQLDELHQGLASLGVSRHQWMFDSRTTLYENYPHGFDLLAEAAESAHKYGIEFYAEIKPFEGGGFGTIFPLTFPYPANNTAYKDIRGIFTQFRPFAAQYPHMNLKRKPGTYEFTGQVKSIRLVKSDDLPTRLKAEHLSVFTSSTNNHFIPYTGPLSFRESIEWRFRFPYWKKCRVLHLEELEIPPGHTYFLIKFTLTDGIGDFSNENGNILELVGENGAIIPHTLSTGPVTFNDHHRIFKSEVEKELNRYFHDPQVQQEIKDLQKMMEHYKDFYTFGEYEVTKWTTLDKQGYIAAVCGKPEYIFGNLHPVYPEVREHWLELTRFCLDRGVDGINFRVANHTRSPEYWEYGFNEPVLELSGGRTDYETISRINGDAYTQFLKEARKLIKSRGKGITIHLNSDMLIPDERGLGRLPAVPPNFEWQWKTWIKDIADDLEFRGVFRLRPWSLDKVLDIFSAETQKANKPFYLQGDFHGMTFEGPFLATKDEIHRVLNHPGLNGFVMYETAYFTRMNENGKIEVSPGMQEVISRDFFRTI